MAAGAVVGAVLAKAVLEARTRANADVEKRPFMAEMKGVCGERPLEDKPRINTCSIRTWQ